MRQKDKNLGSNVMGVNQGRICLSAHVLDEFNSKKGDHIYITIDHDDLILLFRDLKDIKRHARKISDKTPVSVADAEFYLSSEKKLVKIDQRGRITIPDNLINEANINDVVKVIISDRYIALAQPIAIEEKRNEIKQRLRGSN